MADVGIEQLKEDIQDNIKTNNSQAITGAVLQGQLIDTVDTLKGYTDDHVSVSQNTQTGHTEIHIGNNDYPVASVEEVSQLGQEINGLPDIDQPTTEDIQTGKYLSSGGSWETLAEARYLMVDVSSYKGKTLQDTNANSNDLQYAFIKSYNESGAVFSGGRISSKFSSATIPSDANYLYLFFNTTPILPVLHIVESGAGIAEKVENLEHNFTEETVEEQIDITEQSIGVTSKLGYYINYEEPFWKELYGYNSWYFVAQSDCKIYVTDASIYYIAIFNNGEVSASNYVIRMEKRAENLPTQNNPYNVIAGQVVVITSQLASTFTLNTLVLKENIILSDDVFLNNTQIKQVKDAIGPIGNAEMYAEKSADELHIYRKLAQSPYYVCYSYKHRLKTFTQNEYPSFYDNWGLQNTSVVTIKDGLVTTILSLLFSAEAELAVNVTNPNGGYQYVGGGMHGFDNILTDNSGDRNLSIIIDNILVAEDATMALKPVNRVIIQYTGNLYQAYTNSNPFSRVEKIMDYSNDGIFISNKMTLLRTMDFLQAQFGMMKLSRHYLGSSSNPYLVNKAIRNSEPYHIYTVDDAWKESGSSAGIGTLAHDATKITEYGNMGMGFSLEVIESTLKPNGGMKVWHNGGGDAKIYFDLVGSTYSASQDEILSAKVKWEIFGKPIL